VGPDLLARHHPERHEDRGLHPLRQLRGAGHDLERLDRRLRQPGRQRRLESVGPLPAVARPAPAPGGWNRTDAVGGLRRVSPQQPAPGLETDPDRATRCRARAAAVRRRDRPAGPGAHRHPRQPGRWPPDLPLPRPAGQESVRARHASHRLGRRRSERRHAVVRSVVQGGATAISRSTRRSSPTVCTACAWRRPTPRPTRRGRRAA